MQRKNIIALFQVFLFTAWSLHAQASSQKSEGPSEVPYLLVTLTPIADATTFRSIEVSMQIQSPHLATGATLLRMPLVLVGCPSAAYSTSDIHATQAGL